MAGDNPCRGERYATTGDHPGNCGHTELDTQSEEVRSSGQSHPAGYHLSAATLALTGVDVEDQPDNAHRCEHPGGGRQVVDRPTGGSEPCRVQHAGPRQDDACCDPSVIEGRQDW